MQPIYNNFLQSYLTKISTDARELRKSVSFYNKAAKERIRAEYDGLNRLGFIHEEE